MNGQQIVHCPQCGGNKVKSNAKGAFQALLALGILFCITIIGIPLGIAFFIGAFIVKNSKIRLKFLCLECKHDFKIDQDTYHAYSKAIQ
ncbi:hypothetical protein IHV09_14365 [Fictibacillus sp. 23RED33]|uniref:hypothetical protein n=1 Tax=Fictibacillus sp. 23RED33 TaxID=2745879 RepID=UPI0018CDAE29|nr:hypothetical protein [Fictibacillus sp. 23RED33]MBH0174748.1 hypothetical protein [Fictibacillus sp. 23RED33]